MGSSWKNWSGTAFEGICMKHEIQLKKAQGIENVYTETSMWRYKPTEGSQGTQVDLLIDGQNLCINVCEIKFAISEFEITKAYAKELKTN